jgi:hypothetical protein
MKAGLRGFCALALLWTAGVFVALPAGATPLGLNNGDLIQQLEWDSLQSVGGDGGTFDTALGANGGAYLDGRINSVTVFPSITNLTPGVDFRLDADLSIDSSTFINANLLFVNVTFSGSAAVTPDFYLDESGIILTGNLSSPMVIQGIINLLDGSLTPTLLTTVNVDITGGDPALVAAFGGSGQLILTGGLFAFNPNLVTLGGDGNLFNSDFTFSGSGVIVPLSPSPFPEPSAALLLGTGMLGLLALVRRTRRN